MFILFAWVLLALAVFWLIDLFWLERRQLRRAASGGAGSGESLDRPWWRYPSQVLGLPLIVGLIYTAIQESRDLALLLIIGTLFAGLVVVLDRLLLRPYRRFLREATGDDTSIAMRDDSTVVEYARSFFPVLAVVVVLRSFLFEPYQIPSESMRPTLVVGDFLLVNKFSYGLRLPVLKTELVDLGDPQAGDVMVFTPPHQDTQNYIKRVIATEGDRVYYNYQTRELRVNGETVPRTRVERFREDGRVIGRYEETLNGHTYEVYLTENSLAPNWEPLEATVPEGHYFVMGDNRDNSLDSRFWAQQYGTTPFVDDDSLQGKAVLRWMYWPSLFSLPSFNRFGAIE